MFFSFFVCGGGVTHGRESRRLYPQEREYLKHSFFLWVGVLEGYLKFFILRGSVAGGIHEAAFSFFLCVWGGCYTWTRTLPTVPSGAALSPSLKETRQRARLSRSTSSSHTARTTRRVSRRSG